jgi:hypothetical protein
MSNHKAGKQNSQFNMRVESALSERFDAAIQAEAEMHGFEPHAKAEKLRDLMREFVLRIESIKASATAQHAAKVLRKAVRS